MCLFAQTFSKSQLNGTWRVADKTYNEGFSLIRTFNETGAKVLVKRATDGMLHLWHETKV